MPKDLTVGNPVKRLLGFALPLYASAVLQQAYNIVDAAIVGRFCGWEALAGVGAASPFVNFFISLLVGFSVGVSIAVSRLYGKRDLEGIKQVVSVVTLLSALVSAALAVVGVTLAAPLLGLLDTPDEAAGFARPYLMVMLGGMVFTVLFNQMSGLLRGVGESRVPLAYLAFSTCVNIGLDLLLICVAGMGVAGAAWATVVAEGLSCALLAAYLRRRVPMLSATLAGARHVDRGVVASVMRYGLPMGLQQSSISLGHVLMQAIVNSAGATVVAAYACATKVDLLAVMPLVSLGSALATYTAQCLGKGDAGRVHGVERRIDFVSVALAAGIAVIVTAARTPAVSLFVDAASSAASSDVVAVAAGYLLVTAPFYWVLALVHNHLNVVAGAGGTVFYAVMMVAMMLVRVLIAFVFVTCTSLVPTGIWASFPLSWAAALVVTLACERPVLRKLSTRR